MQKYCLTLMGLESYQKKEDLLADILVDIQCFAKRMGVAISLSQAGVMVNNQLISTQTLKTVMGKKRVFDWIMERNRECV